MGWRHAICDACWWKREPDREPVRVLDCRELCCFCGHRETDGIYVMEDPKKVPSCSCGSAPVVN